MKFDTALEAFTTALQIAEANNDSSAEHLAAGLIALTTDLKRELVALSAKTASIENKVNQLR